MSFVVNVNRDLSLAQLQVMADNEIPVVKTPHVGNQYPNNLLVASLGVPMLMVDCTIGVKDENFHPHLVIAGGRHQEIASPLLLTSHNPVLRKPQIAPEWFEKGQPVSVGHMASLRAAIPATRAQTYFEFWADRTDVMWQILQAAVTVCPNLWTRRVNQRGEVQTFDMKELGLPLSRGWRQLMTEGIAGITGESGWLIPNLINIMVDGVVAFLQTGSNTSYSLSGPDMVLYMKDEKKQATLHELYASVRQQLGWGLPEHLNYVIVPVADMRFAVPTNRRAVLDTLVECYIAWKGHGGERGAVMKAVAPASHAGAITRLNARRALLAGRLQAAIRTCPEVFYDIKHANYLSQYDLLVSGERMYTHPWLLHASMDEISEMWRVLQRMAAQT